MPPWFHFHVGYSIHPNYCLVKNFFQLFPRKIFVDKLSYKEYDYNMKLSNYIKKIRIEKGMTQESLGILLGVRPAAVSKYERGRAVPSGNVLWKFLTMFKLIKK